MGSEEGAGQGKEESCARAKVSLELGASTLELGPAHAFVMYQYTPSACGTVVIATCRLCRIAAGTLFSYWSYVQ